MNIKLSKLIYCYCLKGFNQNGQILKLLIVLYRLKILLLLWYTKLTSILAKFGLKLVLNTNYLFTNGRLITFFYIDNIAIYLLKRTF